MRLPVATTSRAYADLPLVREQHRVRLRIERGHLAPDEVDTDAVEQRQQIDLQAFGLSLVQARSNLQHRGARDQSDVDLR
jgi:hypothetical protein